MGKPLEDWAPGDRTCPTCGDDTPCECCVLWTQARSAGGYGQRTVDGKRVYVHRHAYKQAYGPIPEGLLVMHLCDTRACYYAPHLRVGTPRDNVLDAIAKGRVNFARRDDSAPCPQGHVGDTFRKKDGSPACRACNREHARRRREKRWAALGREEGPPPRRLGDDEPCPQGHVGEFSRPRSGKKWSNRSCLVCQRERSRAKRRAQREARESR